MEAYLELERMTASGKDMNNWRSLMNKHGINWREAQAKGVEKNQLDSFSQSGFLAAKFTTDALLTIKGSIDRPAVTETLRIIRNAKSDMLCSPSCFGSGKRHNSNHAGHIAVISDGIWKAQPTACLQPKDPELADILKFDADEKSSN